MLTDEERVIRLLEQREGRMRQTDIAEEFEWSASKTSRTIGSLVEEGKANKFREVNRF